MAENVFPESGDCRHPDTSADQAGGADALAGARVNVVIDIGFGDAIEPGLPEMELPVLLDQPAARLQAYARETVIAEKFQAMVMLGRVNSRLKDLYDIW